MEVNAIKLELIEWLTKLEDNETIEYLKVIKESFELNGAEENFMSSEQKEGIKRALEDIDAGRVTPHEEVINKRDIDYVK